MARNNIYLTLIGKLEKRLSGMAQGTLLPRDRLSGSANDD